MDACSSKILICMTLYQWKIGRESQQLHSICNFNQFFETDFRKSRWHCSFTESLPPIKIPFDKSGHIILQVLYLISLAFPQTLMATWGRWFYTFENRFSWNASRRVFRTTKITGLSKFSCLHGPQKEVYSWRPISLPLSGNILLVHPVFLLKIQQETYLVILFDKFQLLFKTKCHINNIITPLSMFMPIDHKYSYPFLSI